MVLKSHSKIDVFLTLNRKLRGPLTFLLKNIGKIDISHFLNRKLPGNGSKSDRLRRELPEFGVALHARFYKVGPTVAHLRPQNKARAPSILAR